MEEVSAFSLMRFNMKEGRLSWGTMCSIGLNSQAFAAVANLWKTFTSTKSHTFPTFFCSLACLKEEKKKNLGYNYSRIHFEDYTCLCKLSAE